MMSCVALRLEADGLETLDLSSAGFGSNLVDVGFPLVREVAEDAPDADGSVDTSSLSGARVVTVGVTLNPVQAGASRWRMEQRVKAFLNPRLRPRLFVQYSQDDPELMLTLRASDLTNRMVPQRAVRSDLVAQWVCPSGLMESATQHQQTIYPGPGSGAEGVEFDGVEFDGVEFPAVDPPGTALVVNAGDRDAYPVVRMFGPFGDEGTGSDETVLANITSGRSLVFAGTGISGGDYLEVDFREKTILVNGLSSQSRYGRIVFPDSAWWTLAPGSNEIAFRPDTYSGNAQALVLWRDAHS